MTSTSYFTCAHPGSASC